MQYCVMLSSQILVMNCDYQEKEEECCTSVGYSFNGPPLFTSVHLLHQSAGENRKANQMLAFKENTIGFIKKKYDIGVAEIQFLCQFYSFEYMHFVSQEVNHVLCEFHQSSQLDFVILLGQSIQPLYYSDNLLTPLLTLFLFRLLQTALIHKAKYVSVCE